MDIPLANSPLFCHNLSSISVSRSVEVPFHQLDIVSHARTGTLFPQHSWHRAQRPGCSYCSRRQMPIRAVKDKAAGNWWPEALSLLCIAKLHPTSAQSRIVPNDFIAVQTSYRVCLPKPRWYSLLHTQVYGRQTRPSLLSLEAWRTKCSQIQ